MQGSGVPKSLLLMAENFYALDDPFQAVFILDTIIENFNRYPEVQEKAKRLKARYEAAEEQTEQQQNTSEKPTKKCIVKGYLLFLFLVVVCCLDKNAKLLKTTNSTCNKLRSLNPIPPRFPK